MLKLLILLFVPIFAFASSGQGETDIFWRTFNFIIFAGIIYYLLANKIKSFFIDRKNSIAQRLSDIQEKLKESETKKNQAIEKVEEAKANAKSFLLTSEKENKLLLDRLNSDLNNELDNLEKSQKDQMEIEKRKVTRQVINEVLEELFNKNVSVDKNKFIDIITKKVS